MKKYEKFDITAILSSTLFNEVVLETKFVSLRSFEIISSSFQGQPDWILNFDGLNNRLGGSKIWNIIAKFFFGECINEQLLLCRTHSLPPINFLIIKLAKIDCRSAIGNRLSLNRLFRFLHFRCREISFLPTYSTHSDCFAILLFLLLFYRGCIFFVFSMAVERRLFYCNRQQVGEELSREILSEK